MLNHSLTPHVALGRHETIDKDEGVSKMENDNSFELRMIRECEENKEIFSTYDKQGTRTAASWLLNYGFVPLKLTHEDLEETVDITDSDTNSDTAAAATDAGTDGADSTVSAFNVMAVEELRLCGPHTHGAIRLVTHK